MIGLKTAAMLVCTAVGALALWALEPARLWARSDDALLAAGLFGVLAGGLAFRVFRLGEASAQAFRLSSGALWDDEAHFLGGERLRLSLAKNEGEAFDFSGRTQLFLCVALALLTGVSALDSRAAQLLRGSARGAASPSSSFCPEPGAQPVDPGADPSGPGCALLRRAVALGYAQSLGDCGAKQKTGAAAELCTRRQRDEPFLHYAYRLLDAEGTRLQQAASPEALARARGEFRARLDRLQELGAAEAQVLTSGPHSAHHLYTNLPAPQAEGPLPEACADRYRFLSHRPPADVGPGAASRVFEHVVGQLLFESRYEPAAGSCREYHLHWGAPADACRQLAANPVAFLERTGALTSMRETLARRALGEQLAALAHGPSAGATAERLAPSQVVSVQCYVEAPGGDGVRAAIPFTLDGVALSAGELRAPPSPAGATLLVDRYDLVAKLLVQGFHYGALLSEAGLESGSVEGLEPSFSSSDYLLSRLYGLASLDLYLAPGWLRDREDVLEVYPYQRHLRNYVRVFRHQYVRERGRL